MENDTSVTNVLNHHTQQQQQQQLLEKLQLEINQLKGSLIKSKEEISNLKKSYTNEIVLLKQQCKASESIVKIQESALSEAKEDGFDSKCTKTSTQNDLISKKSVLLKTWREKVYMLLLQMESMKFDQQQNITKFNQSEKMKLKDINDKKASIDILEAKLELSDSQ